MEHTHISEEHMHELEEKLGEDGIPILEDHE